MSLRALAFLLALLVSSVPTAALAQDGEPVGAVSVLAHRGASAYAPEHTFFAYDLAVEQDTDFLECDLQMTSDGVLVCVHDSTVDRTSDGSGDVEQLTLAELRQLDWGSWFEASDPAVGARFSGAQVVPFEEQLDCYAAVNPRLRFHIETKSPDSLGGAMEEELVRVLDARGLVPAEAPSPQVDPAIVQSFSRRSLEIVKDLEPRLATALLFAAPDQANVTLLEALTGQMPAVADVMAPNAAFLTAHPLYVDAVHANGGEVHTWTVDDAARMDRLLAMGVDGIFTNRPDVARGRIDAGGSAVPADIRGNPPVVDPLCPGTAGTIERDAVSEALRFAGLAFSASGPAVVAERGAFAYAPDVLLARDDVFADALGAGAAQGLLQAPLLLTDGDVLDGRVRAELVRLGAERVHLLGGEAAVSPAVEQALVDLGYAVSRLAGEERIATALAVADASLAAAAAAGTEVTTAVIARADGPGTAAFVDALGAGALGVSMDAPVLLTATDGLSPATAAWLEASTLTDVVVAGGESAVSAVVEADLRALGLGVTRAGGPTRFETAVELARAAGHESGADVDTIVLVDGTAPDGWTAGFTATSQAMGRDAVVLPVAGESVPTPVAEWLGDGTGEVVCALAVDVGACPDHLPLRGSSVGEHPAG